MAENQCFNPNCPGSSGEFIKVGLYDIDFLCDVCIPQFNFVMESTDQEIDRIRRVKQGYDDYIGVINGA